MFENWHLIKRLFPYMRPYKLRAWALVVLTVLGALFALAAPWPLALLLDSVIADEEHRRAFPTPARFLADWGVPGQILFVVLLGFFFVLLGHLIEIGKRAADARLELGMVLDFRSDLFQHVQRLSFQYHERGSAGRFIYQINMLAHDAGSIPTAVLPLAEAALTVIGMFLVTFLIAPKIAIVAALVVPVAYVATMQYGKRVEPMLVRARDLEGESMNIIHEKLSIVRVVVSFCHEQYEHARFRKQGEHALNTRVRVTITQTLFGMGVALITAAGTAAVLLMGANAVVDRQISVGDLTVILAYVASVYRPIEQIAHGLASLQYQLIQMKIVFEVLDAEIEVKEKPGAIALPPNAGHIRLEDVSFHYDTRPRTLEHIDLTIERGEFVAIVGRTGAGKSTLVSLLPRFFDPHEGRVLIDGHDVRDLTLFSLRSSISLVMQDAVLFSGTIADNIRYGRLDATDDEVIAAAQAANCHDFIAELPQGYETTIGERGARISGGERQRIAVARAFLKDAPILILDEPTSAIDSRTEGVILEALERLAAGRTTLMIAHRLSTLRRADRIVVVDDGRVVEHGTHAELLARGETYTALWHAQFGEPGPDAATVSGVEPAPDGPGRTALALPVPGNGNGHGETLPVVAAASPRRLAAPPRPTVVVLGGMTAMPIAGAVWQTMQYLIGLERLGIDVYYVEGHDDPPATLGPPPRRIGPSAAADLLGTTLRRFGLDGHWAYEDPDGEMHGMTGDAVSRLYRQADAIINLRGGSHPRAEQAATGRLVYVETDALQLHAELTHPDAAAASFLEPHAAFYVMAENVGRPGCAVARSDRFDFRGTRQPVVLDLWADHGTGPARSYTTVGTWRQPWRAPRSAGASWSGAHLDFDRFLDLPAATGARFELALTGYGPDDRARLESHGWHVTDALGFAVDLDAHRSYIGGSRGELAVAKAPHVHLRSGWLGDRSAAYLAAGRPVVAEDTGFGDGLPTGAGLFAVSSADEAAAAVADIERDYDRQRRAARDVAAGYFSHDRVLRSLLYDIGIEPARRLAARLPEPMSFPDELDLGVGAGAPAELPPATVASVLAHPLPTHDGAADTPAVSVVVCASGELVLARLCLESVLTTSRRDVELVVVDDGSRGVTAAYLDDLARQVARVDVVRNEEPHGFAAAINQAVRAARGDLLVVVTEETVVAPGWLDAIELRLADPTIGAVAAIPSGTSSDTPYRTLGGFVEHAAGRGREYSGRDVEQTAPTMRCLALRRDVVERIGPLDEQFERRAFVEQDLVLRLDAAGVRLVHAGDVTVHVVRRLDDIGDDESLLLTGDPVRFEHKWSRPWPPRHDPSDATYHRLVRRVRDVMSTAVPRGAIALVLSRGDDALLAVEGRTLWHFPRDDDGSYRGWYPGSSTDLLVELDRQLALGATHLVVPEPSSWWLEFYEGFAERITHHFDEVVDDQLCRVFAARQPARHIAPPPAPPAVSIKDGDQS